VLELGHKRIDLAGDVIRGGWFRGLHFRRGHAIVPISFPSSVPGRASS
jgi:hypothetical protein